MKTQSSTKALVLLLASVLLFSCTTEKTMPSVSFKEGYGLFGEEAAAYYQQKLMEEESPLLRYNYLYSLYEAEALEECRNECLEALRLYPEYLRFHYLLALTLEEIGTDEEKAEAYEVILGMDPTDEKTIQRLLELYQDLGQKEKAIAMAKEKLFLLEDKKEALNILGEESEFYKALWEEKYN